MSDEQPAEQQVAVSITKVVDFYGDRITAAQGADGDVYVPLNPLTVFLGLNRRGQMQRIERDPVLSKRRRVLRIDTGGGPQKQVCLPLDMLPGWLFGISQARVSADLQEKLNRYREECFKVLWNAFKQDILPASTPSNHDLTPAQQTLEMIRAMEHLAIQQVEIEGRVSGIEGRQGTLEGYMRGFIQDTRSRLTALELRLDPTAVISEEQAAQLVIAVKTLAYALEELGKVGTYQSGYARVYSELYRRFDVKTYKNLRRERFDAALAWLREWYDQVAGQVEQEAGSGQ